MKIYKLKQSGGRGNYYIPCEIISLTRSLFYNREIAHLFNGLTINEQIEKYVSSGLNTPRFNQDPLVFVKDLSRTDYALIITSGTELLPLSHLQKLYPLGQIISQNGNDKGGNFISSPPTERYPTGCIFCYEGLTPQLYEYFTNNFIQPLTELKCSFRANKERHIDESMCFMPYGNKFKVWIYYVRNIILTDDLILKLNINCDHIWLSNQLIELQSKLPGKSAQIQTILISRDQAQIISAYRQIRNYLSGDLLECLNRYILGVNYDEFRDLHKLRDQFNQELITNVNLISNKLFGLDFSQNDGNFVFFPIDLRVNGDKNYKYSYPPIFNRLWIETSSGCVCITPNIDDVETQKIYDHEKLTIRSIINPHIPIIFKTVNTLSYHHEGVAGGNIHCLVKQLFA